MGRQLGDEAIGQRLDRIVLIVLRLGRLATYRDDGTLHDQFSRIAADFHAIPALRGDRRFVLGSDIAAIDVEAAVMGDTDEHASTADINGLVADRSRVKGGERRLDLAEALVDLVRQLTGALIFSLELLLLADEGINRRLFFGSQVECLALQFAQAAGRVGFGAAATAQEGAILAKLMQMKSRRKESTRRIPFRSHRLPFARRASLAKTKATEVTSGHRCVESAFQRFLSIRLSFDRPLAPVSCQRQSYSSGCRRASIGPGDRRPRMRNIRG